VAEQNTAQKTASGCIPNIGSREGKKRLMIGAGAAAVSATILAVLLAAGVSLWWRLLLLLPFWVSAVGFFQAKEKT
jgi:hypothetical protein